MCCRNSASRTALVNSWVCYCSRYVDTPMNIYYGPGVTEEDLAEDTNEYLASIAATLERACPPRRCCR